jgi:receptor expression-enhancing protein 5/6
MEGVVKILNPIINDITKDFEKCAPLMKFADKLGVQPGHIVGGGFLTAIILISLGFASSFLTAMLGFLYPAYMSFKALESETKEDDEQWLTYWVVFIFINFLDNVVGIFFSIIPLYHLVKLIFYIYLYYPRSNGATVIYNKVLRPFLKKYESQVDSVLKKGEEKIKAN